MAHRAQALLPDDAGQALIRQSEPQVLQLVKQGADPQVRVLDQPGGDVVGERLKTIRFGPRPDPRRAVTGQILADRLLVELGVSVAMTKSPLVARWRSPVWPDESPHPVFVVVIRN